MRDDVVEASAVVGHTPDVVWQIVGSPEWYSRFVPEIAGCEIVEHAARGRGPRGVIRIAPERGPIMEAQVQAVVYRPGEHVVWCGVPDEGTWVSLELRPLAGGKTELFVRMMLPPSHADLVSSAKKDVRALARRLDLHLAGQADPDADRDGNKATKLRTTSVLLRAGVLSAGRPDKIARQLNSLAQWGATIAGGYQAAAARVPDEPRAARRAQPPHLQAGPGAQRPARERAERARRRRTRPDRADVPQPRRDGRVLRRRQQARRRPRSCSTRACPRPRSRTCSPSTSRPPCSPTTSSRRPSRTSPATSRGSARGRTPRPATRPSTS